jgi:hypothetical protein
MLPVMNTYATIEESLEVIFSMLSMPRLYNENQWDTLVSWVSALIV